MISFVWSNMSTFLRRLSNDFGRGPDNKNKKGKAKNGLLLCQDVNIYINIIYICMYLLFLCFSNCF